MNTSPLIDLSKFLDKGTRYGQRTFQIGGHAYATNGRIMIRVAGQIADMADDSEKRAMDSVLRDAHPVGDWMMLPPRAPSSPEKCRCEECQDCDECDGCGEHECPHCGSDMRCRRCDGTGKRSDDCKACRGTGWIKRSEWQDSPEMYVKLFLYDLMASLPNVMWARTKKPDMIAIRFDGGDGVCMLARKST